ncbi:MAG: hypothetical protein AAB320_11290 [Elusimicrobiota bacterium]
MRVHPLALALLAVSGALTLPSVRAAGFSDEDRQYLGRYRALLEVSPDPCGIASKLEAGYRRILKQADKDQGVADIRAAVEGKPGFPLRLADGVRLTEGVAMYDQDTRSVYLSSASISRRLPAAEGACPSDERIESLARDTVGVYVHEVSHALEHAALGEDLVTSSEGEILAYARECRFLSRLKGWPPRSLALEVKRRKKNDELIAENQAIMARLKKMQGQPPGKDGLARLEKYVHKLEAIRQKMARLEEAKIEVDGLQLMMATMLDKWNTGWPDYIHFMLIQTRTRPSLSRREENLDRARPFLADAVAGLKVERPGTLSYQMMERSVRLGEQDVRFWGDQAQVDRALAFYKQGFHDVRPAPRAKPRPGPKSRPKAKKTVLDPADQIQ